MLCPVGATSRQSYRNFVNWLDALVINWAEPGSEVLLHDVQTGDKLDGLYQCLMPYQHSRVISDITVLNKWASSCNEANISAGKFISVEGTGKGSCTFVQLVIGPFN